MAVSVDILTITNQYRDALIAQERAVEDDLIARYAAVRRQIQDDLAALTLSIQRAVESGDDLPASWLYRQDRYQQIIAQIDDQITSIADDLVPAISTLQADAIGLAVESTRAILTVQGATNITRFPVSAFVEQVGRLSDGSPLARLLGELSGQAQQGIEQALLNGIAQGLSPRTVGRQVSNALGGNMARGMRIARNEQVSSYRNASLQSYRANSDIGREWVWSAQLGSRTCASCIAQHGSIHPLTEPFASHVACRCAPIFRVTGSTLTVESGSDWFARQDAFTQRGILGPAKHRAYQDGAITLDDLVQRGTDAQWGQFSREGSLVRALGSRANEYYGMAAG